MKKIILNILDQYSIKRSTIIYMLLFIVLSFSYLIYRSVIYGENNYYDVSRTKSSQINGKITDIMDLQGKVYCKIDSSEKGITLPDSYNYLYEDYAISDFLVEGDSLFKEKNCDTLYVFRGKKRYLFILGNLDLNRNKSKYKSHSFLNP